VFYGSKDLLIDDKGRLILPSGYRSGFALGAVYAVLGLDSCIELLPTDVFEKKAQGIMSLSDFDPKARVLKRTFLANAFDLQVDTHGRILLPKPLLEKTGMGRSVKVVGMYDHLEIWDKEVFEKAEALAEKDYSENAKALSENGHGV